MAHASWEPHWTDRLDRVHLRVLVEMVHDIVIARGFYRSLVYRATVVDAEDPNDLLDGVAAWERITEESAELQTMNGASCYGNGLVRIQLDRGRHLELLTSAAVPPEHTAACIEAFIDQSDQDMRTRLFVPSGVE